MKVREAGVLGEAQGFNKISQMSGCGIWERLETTNLKMAANSAIPVF